MNAYWTFLLYVLPAVIAVASFAAAYFVARANRRAHGHDPAE
jgi:hypothetical protein